VLTRPSLEASYAGQAAERASAAVAGRDEDIAVGAGKGAEDQVP
jgi:hypothetical protein